MFNNKQDLYEFLLTNDFNDKYSNIEYKYLLLSFREYFRKLHSENSGLNNKINELERQIEQHKDADAKRDLQLNIKQHYIKELKLRLVNRIPWYKKWFKKNKNGTT